MPCRAREGGHAEALFLIVGAVDPDNAAWARWLRDVMESWPAQLVILLLYAGLMVLLVRHASREWDKGARNPYLIGFLVVSRRLLRAPVPPRELAAGCGGLADRLFVIEFVLLFALWLYAFVRFMTRQRSGPGDDRRRGERSGPRWSGSSKPAGHRRPPDESQGAAPPARGITAAWPTRSQTAAPPGARGEDHRGDDRPLLPRPPRDRCPRGGRRALPRVRRAAGLRAPPPGEVPLRRGEAHLRQLRDALLQAGDARAGAGGHALQRAADAPAPPGARRRAPRRRAQDAGRRR